MTTPHERSRALVWAGGFLIELARDKSLPLSVRQQAVKIARHFPTIEQVASMAATTASSPSTLENEPAISEWARECQHGPLTFHTRLGWPSDSDSEQSL